MSAPFVVINDPGDLGPGTSGMDANGNIFAAGNISILAGYLGLGLMASAPGPIPGTVLLYTLDGVTLRMVAAGGQSAGLVLPGNLTVSGTTTMTGTLNTVNGDLSILSSDAAGGFFLSNTQTVTSGADMLLNENASTSKAFAIAVTGDVFNRYLIDAAGNISWGSGSLAQDTTLGRSAAGVLSVTTGSFSVTTAGQGLRVKEGSNAKQGTSILAGGAAVVANTSVTANSRIFLTSQADGGAPGFLRVSARTAGTSFTITSSSGTDTSTVAWQIFEPA